MRAVVVLALAGLISACVPPAFRRTPRVTAEERQAYDKAIAAAVADPAAGMDQLRAFLARWPASALADDAGLRLAELDRDRGNLDQAVYWLRWVIEHQPTGDRTDSARLLLARIERKRGDADAAWQAVSGLRISMLPEAERPEAHRLLAELAESRGERAEALHWLAEVREDAEDETGRRAAQARIDALLAGLSPKDIANLADQLGRRLPAASLWLRAARAWIDAGDLQAAGKALERARGLPLTRAEADELARLETRSAAPTQAELESLPPPFRVASAHPPPDLSGARGTLGVILPLTGPLADIGQRCLQGILLATRVFDADAATASNGESGVRLVVRDSGGDPARAAAAVRELAAQPGITAVLGPLLAEDVTAAASAADQVHLPLLTLTRHESAAKGHPWVFRIGLTPRVEADTLAEYAVGTLGLRRFGILYPRDAYGRQFERLFWHAVERRGGTVTAVAGYAPDATDFGTPIRRMIGYVLLTPDEKKAIQDRDQKLEQANRLPPEQARALREKARAATGPDGEPLPPIVDFDALFIPDSHDKVELIAPQLAFHDVDGVRLLGPSAWNDPDLVRIAGRHVDGAVFTVAFDAESPFAIVHDFEQRYQDTFGAPPDVFGAEGFDAANLAQLELVNGRTAPDAFRKGLLSVHAWPGVSGVISFLADGNARKRPFLLSVRGGHIVSLD